MINQKVDKRNILTIISTISPYVFISVFFIALTVNVFLDSIISFSLIAISIIMFYYFSEDSYNGILIGFTIIALVLDIAFMKQKYEVYFVLLEYASIVCLYLILEMYKDKYISIKNSLFEKYDMLNIEIASIDYEISKNKEIVSDLKRHIKDLRKIGKVLQSFQASFDEKKIVEKSEDIAYKFIGKGSWKLKKYSDDDIFAFYMKSTSLPLMIANISNDKRFFLKQNKNNEKMSLIAVPIEFNGIFWGTLQGSSDIKDFFSENDLRQLYLLSGIISTVLNNSYFYKRLQTLAITDGLTGLYNQIYFKEMLREELSRSQSNKLPLSLGILDIDFFKNINDKYGHQAGDSILRQISSLLRARFRETDFIARYGGEEFVFIMLHTNSREAAKILEHIRLRIEKQRFFLPVKSLFPVQIKITVSIGFVSLDKNSSISDEEFIKNADTALYKAKQLGRNKVEGFFI
jgi:diguanylate cyclase (GGDEF)-like protein